MSRRLPVILALVVLCAVFAGAVAAGELAQCGKQPAPAKAQLKKLVGTVTFICPQCKLIKVKCSGGKVWTFWVDEAAKNAAAIKEQLKQLKVNDPVVVCYTEKGDKLFIVRVKKMQKLPQKPPCPAK